MSYNSKYTGAEVEALLDSVEGKQDAIEDLDAIRAGAAAGATALQSVPSEYVTESELANKGYATTSALNDKVDKVSGKQLSTEDFTTNLKSKLEGLMNYNDTEVYNAINGLQAQINTLIEGNVSEAIESFNEIMAFLDGIKDTEDLAGIIASIERQIADKMDKVTLATVATSGDYNDLSNKPTIPSEQVNADWNATSGKAQIFNKPTIPAAVTESTVSGWGFTKNTGTYSKPSGGIPKTDLASAVQTSLGKADTAVQPDAISEFVTTEDLAAVATSGSYNDLTDQPFIPNADSVRTWGFVKGVKLNGSTKTPSVSDGIVDLGTISGGSGGGSSAYSEVNHGTSDTTFTLTPNTFHVWDEVSALTLTLGSETSGVANEYIFQFTSGSTATSLTLPDDIKWTEELVIEANRIYQVSILKGLASVLSWDNANTSLIENHITYEEGDFMNGGTITFEYPTASELIFAMEYYSSSELVIPQGTTQMTIDWFEPQAPIIISMSPTNDSTYKYIFV